MLSNLELKNFKGFQSAQIGPFAQLNVISGSNNAGKTALLEAIATFLKRGKVDSATRSLREKQIDSELLSPVEKQRSESASRDWASWLVATGREHAFLRGNFLAGSGIVILSRSTATPVELRRIAGIPEAAPGSTASAIQGLGPFVANFPQNDKAHTVGVVPFWPSTQRELVDAFETMAIEQEPERVIVEWLKAMDPRVSEIRSLAPKNRPRQLFASVGAESRIPLSQLGQGANRLMQIASIAYSCRGGVLIVDEIESGVHHSFMKAFWSTLLKMCTDWKIQLFATTHSYECLTAVAEVTKEKPGNQLAFHRLERHEDRTVCITASENTLQAAIDSGFEVR